MFHVKPKAVSHGMSWHLRATTIHFRAVSRDQMFHVKRGTDTVSVRRRESLLRKTLPLPHHHNHHHNPGSAVMLSNHHAFKQVEAPPFQAAPPLIQHHHRLASINREPSVVIPQSSFIINTRQSNSASATPQARRTGCCTGSHRTHRHPAAADACRAR